MIEWKGLFANTPYSSANNKTQDDAVVGMQDTIYVTGPGYGGYSANVRVHNASGAVVALIPVCGGGGALSAPAPVRILDDSTTYSYSLEVVRGVIPTDDADKIVIRIIGGASKRYPGQVSTLSDGSISFSGAVVAPNTIRRHSRATWQPWPMGTPLSAGTATTTSQVMGKAPCRSSRMRAAFGSASYSGNNAYNVSKCAFGTTNTLETFTPSVGGTVTEDATTGLVSAISSPLAVAQNTLAMASKVWTNWVRVPLLQDSEGSWIWLARYQFDAGGAAYASSYGNNSRVDTYGNYWQMKRVTTGANDFFGAQAADFGPAADAAGFQTFCHTLEVQFGGCEGGQISVGAFGASTIYGGAGGLGTDNRGGFIAATNKYSQTNDLRVSITNHAKNTQTTEAVYQHIVSYGINSEYDAILMPVFSSNDGYTEANVALQMARAFEIREQAAAYGQTVLFVILPHNGASSGDALAVRKAAEARLFAAGGVIDLCPIVQGTSRYTWDAAYSGDGIHASEAGVQRLNSYAPPIIASAVKAHCS